MDLELRTQLQQTISPQLIQSLKILQIPTLELEQYLKQELQVNPFLEEVESEAVTEEFSDDTEEFTDTQAQIDGWDEYLKLKDGFNSGDRYYEAYQKEEEEIFRNEGVAPTSLAAYLIDQLHLQELTAQEITVGEYIIGNLDDSGFLTCSVEEIAAQLNVELDLVERVLKVVQQLDPVGVGCRDIRECLLVQLQAQGLEDTLAARIVRDHLDDLENRRYSAITKALKVEVQDIQQAAQIIGTLTPKPGAQWSSEPTQVIVPDLVVEKVDDDYVVVLNDRNVPRLRISTTYRSIVRQSTKMDDTTKQFVVDKLNSARWLVKSLQQRRSTILKVMHYIVKAQREFLDKGLAYLKPMVLQEVADAIEMHPSTVSRVTVDKFVQTPRGTFPLKFFFDGGIEHESGEEMATKRVKDRIAQLIVEEDPKAPLSDNKIADLLQQEGIHIARRTVAKYRDQLAILPARFRKTV